ncbi:hypothetical protein LG943_03705 [Streptomonospora sp. S1-112]|uniref:Uncharacterized protein n=1 Tax=Streptomonospora mangrovi TaxID=2883123 RepID=A0A9X3NHS8_9ACTN|nr:hypothetical protein [Streptomonospora mangrovi]MDA0563438.1 hypothetical protein [Streptomonospora mangrovi]
MRHLVGFLVGLILAPVVALGTGWVLPRFIDLDADGRTFATAGGLVAVGTLAVVALLVGLALALPRLTPLLPGVAGLTLAGLTTAHHLRPDLVERVPALPGLEGAVTLLELGAYLPLGLALFLPMLIPSRWAGRERRPEVTEEEYFDGLYDEDYEDPQRPRWGTAPDAGGHHRRGADAG